MPKTATPSPDLLDTDAAATYLHLRPQTLTNWRSLGNGPAFVRLGRRVLYLRSDLDAFISTCAKASR